MIFGINTTRDISKLSQISLASRLVKLRITISKYHPWFYAKNHFKSCYYLYKFTHHFQRLGKIWLAQWRNLKSSWPDIVEFSGRIQILSIFPLRVAIKWKTRITKLANALIITLAVMELEPSAILDPLFWITQMHSSAILDHAAILNYLYVFNFT